MQVFCVGVRNTQGKSKCMASDQINNSTGKVSHIALNRKALPRCLGCVCKHISDDVWGNHQFRIFTSVLFSSVSLTDQTVVISLTYRKFVNGLRDESY